MIFFSRSMHKHTKSLFCILKYMDVLFFFQFHLFFVEKPGENKQVNYNINQEQSNSILDLKKYSNIGWYNLSKRSPDYKYGLDLVFLCFQYMIVPTILENNGFYRHLTLILFLHFRLEY